MLSTPQTGPLPGQAGDIGGGGLLFVGKGHDLGVEIGATGEIQFEVLGEAFTFPVTLVRRMETVDRCELALSWPAAQPRDVDRLMYCLYKIELSRRNPPSLPMRAPARPAPKAGAWRREWLLVAALGVAAGALLSPGPVLPTLIIAALLALWLVTAPH